MSNIETIRKIKVPVTTDDNLLEQYKEQGNCVITWIKPRKGEETVPPENTAAVVVNVPKNKGAIRIFEKPGSDKRIGAVGTEDAGYMVIIPWEGKWWFRVSGSPGVGYIQKLSDHPVGAQAMGAEEQT